MYQTEGFNPGGQRETQTSNLSPCHSKQKFANYCLGLKHKAKLLKHRYTLRGRVGSYFEVKPALIYRVKGVYKELFFKETGVING